MTPAFSMVGILLSSSVVLQWGQRAVQRGHDATGRLAIVLTIALGLAFFTMQISLYARRAYGSVLFVIAGIHGANVLLGLLMLSILLFLPRIGASNRPPHHPMENAARYWHIVDAAWIVIVVSRYVLPRLS